MNLRQRLGWLARTALLLFALGAAAFLSAVTAIRFAIQGREVEVPLVVGLKAGDAQARLADHGLGLRIADRVYSEQPVDHVVRQSPLAGTRVKVNQRTQVVLSLGAQKLPIPKVEGNTLRAARLALLRAGLQVGEISSTPLGWGEAETVVKQNPPPGEMGAGSPRVNMLVSLGPPEAAYLMPDLENMMLGEAQARISAGGLRLTKVTPVAAGEAPRGTVVRQTPPRGARVLAGTAVELEVRE